jgi:hypothetical protein
MKKLASLTGYTPGSASAALGKIKRKLKNQTAGISEDNPTPKKPQGRPRTASAKKTPTKRTATDDGDDNDSPSFSKRAKKNGAAKKLHDEDLEDDDEKFIPTIKKEEITDITNGVIDFYSQVQNAAGYGFELDES